VRRLRTALKQVREQSSVFAEGEQRGGRWNGKGQLTFLGLLAVNIYTGATRCARLSPSAVHRQGVRISESVDRVLQHFSRRRAR